MQTYTWKHGKIILEIQLSINYSLGCNYADSKWPVMEFSKPQFVGLSSMDEIYIYNSCLGMTFSTVCKCCNYNA